ncbi:MAG: UvrB/UvrC motif-containing protein [Verrucomicrobiia bacterium]
MLCSICKQKQATVHLTKIIGDKMHKIDLCEDCAKKQGLTEGALDVTEFLFGFDETSPSSESEETVELKCPACGYTQSHLKKTGRLGCAECYNTFAEGLEGILKSMHKGSRHVGKVPRAQQSGKTIAEKIKKLQEELERAVAIEDFERAAVLRDEIKRIRAKLNQVEK